jgi:hypothetical protein
MAKKVNLMALALENRRQSDPVSQWPAPVVPALYLMRLRTPRFRISPPKRKLPVAMDAEARAQVEHPVKIIHVG